LASSKEQAAARGCARSAPTRRARRLRSARRNGKAGAQHGNTEAWKRAERAPAAAAARGGVQKKKTQEVRSSTQADRKALLSAFDSAFLPGKRHPGSNLYPATTLPGVQVFSEMLYILSVTLN